MDRDDRRSRAPAWRILLLTLLMTTAAWAFYYRHSLSRWESAVPFLAETEKRIPEFAFMQPGDHLQLMYHFWLFEDMLRGQTPWFGNVYEFNLGDDAARREPGAYYFPFSLFFAIGDAIAGRAFGWNLAGFASFWLAAVFTVLLLRRHTARPAWVWLLTAFCLLLPYRWHCFAGGSPSGFAMCWPPLFFLGLDIAVRDARWRGGFLAGLALLFAAWDDTHTLFFCALFAPVWCLFALLRLPRLPDLPSGWLRIALRLAPVAGFLALAMLTSKNMTGNMAESRGPRSWREVALSSPHLEGLYAWEHLGFSDQIFIGYGMIALLAAGVIAFIVLSVRGRDGRRVALAAFVLIAAIAAAALLAAGVHGFGGLPVRAARKLIPKYDMIRQTAKIFTILPPLIAVAAALSFRAIADTLRNRRAVAPALAALAGFICIECGMQFMLHFCLLAPGQPAYAAAATDATKNGARPHALVIPFWPGDSHYTSVYQYYASQHRIRMVNGYRPFVPESYRMTIFRAFESANLGELSDVQLDDLQKRGVNTIILHEDLFPEKVSPVPVTFTLKNLLNHPRLTPLAHDGCVWSWRIDSKPRPVILPRGTNWTTRLPTQKSAKLNPPAMLAIAVGQTVTFPAPVFFHAGTIDLERDSVRFDPVREGVRMAMYGPRLPVPPGRYEIAIDFDSPQREGLLGEWHVESPEGAEVALLPMRGGGKFSHELSLPSGGLLLMYFNYDATAPLEIKTIALRRIE